MISLPGRPCDIPLPPDLCEAFGYRGEARFVGFHGWPGSGKVVIDDGVSSSTANGWVFGDFRRYAQLGITAIMAISRICGVDTHSPGLVPVSGEIVNT
jgi:hypothetical protein